MTHELCRDDSVITSPIRPMRREQPYVSSYGYACGWVKNGGNQVLSAPASAATLLITLQTEASVTVGNRPRRWARRDIRRALGYPEDYQLTRDLQKIGAELK